MLTPTQQRKRYLLMKANETPEQKAIRLAKAKERRRLKVLTQLEIENRKSYARKRYRSMKLRLEKKLRDKINRIINKNKNKKIVFEEKPKRKYTHRKQLAEATVPIPKDDDDDDLDWQDIFTTRLLGFEEKPTQRPDIKTEHAFEEGEHLQRKIEYLRTETVKMEPCIQQKDDGVVEYLLNAPKIKEETDDDITVGEYETLEDIEIGPEVKQEFLCYQLQPKANTTNMPSTLFPEFGIKQETEKESEIRDETIENIKFECIRNASTKMYPEIKQQRKSPTKFSKLPPLRSKNEAHRLC